MQRALGVSLFLSLMISFAATAETTLKVPVEHLKKTGSDSPPAKSAPTAGKKKLSSQIYESEEAGTSFKAKVKAIRDLSGEIEVFFEHKKYKAPFVLAEGPDQETLKEKLELSAKPGGPEAQVTLNEKDQIISVEIPEKGGTP